MWWWGVKVCVGGGGEGGQDVGPWNVYGWILGRPTSPNLHNPFSPSLISLMVFVDVKHHVYLPPQ